MRDGGYVTAVAARRWVRVRTSAAKLRTSLLTATVAFCHYLRFKTKCVMMVVVVVVVVVVMVVVIMMMKMLKI